MNPFSSLHLHDWNKLIRSQFNCSTRSRINTDHCDGRGDVSYRYWNEVQHTSFVLILCTQQVRSEHIEIVVPVVMEMLRRVHEKFTLHYNLILPPIGRKNAIAPHADVSFVNKKESLFYPMLAEHCKACMKWIVFFMYRTLVSA